jgi:hypothetical protein
LLPAGKEKKNTLRFVVFNPRVPRVPCECFLPTPFGKDKQKMLTTVRRVLGLVVIKFIC